MENNNRNQTNNVNMNSTGTTTTSHTTVVNREELSVESNLHPL